MTENRMHRKIDDAAHTAISSNINDLKQYCLQNTISILKNILVLKCTNYSHIAHMPVDEPAKFALSIRSPKAMLYYNHANNGGI